MLGFAAAVTLRFTDSVSDGITSVDQASLAIDQVSSRTRGIKTKLSEAKLLI